MKKNLLTPLFLCILSLYSYAQTGDGCPGNWLSTQGNQLIDSSGNPVKLSGVNWFGFETQLNNPHGLWGGTRDFKSMLQQVKDLGFNCLRIPWHNRMLEAGEVLNVNAGGTDPYTGISPMNAVEATYTQPIQLLDALVQWCQDNDMKVILDCHSRNPDAFAEELRWYTSDFTQQQWINDWVFLADRYSNFDAVIGMDINNEPHGSIGDSNGAKWGTGNPSDDWSLAAQECGNAIHAVNPNVLIIVEGIEAYQKPDGTNTSYWWGGNLQGVRDFPITLNLSNKLMYSPHEYGPEVFDQPWFSDPSFPNNMAGIWEEQFNFINSSDTTPLLVGEFGIKEQGGVKEQWFSTFTSYIANNDLNYTYWCLNPNSGDTGGILQDDWFSVNQWKMGYLQPILYPTIPNCFSALSVTEFEAPETIKLFPNPANEILNIEYVKGIETLSVYDINGRLVNSISLASSLSYKLNTEQLKAGFYILEITNAYREMITSKFIKK